MTPVQRSEALRAGEEAAEFHESHHFAAARQAIAGEWLKAKTTEERESLWFEIQAMDRVIDRLRTLAQNAQVAAMEIKAEQTALTGKVDPYVHA